jgi:hypothetical protein
VIVNTDSTHKELVLYSSNGATVDQQIELGDHYESDDGNSYSFTGTKLIARFTDYAVIRLVHTSPTPTTTSSPITSTSPPTTTTSPPTTTAPPTTTSPPTTIASPTGTKSDHGGLLALSMVFIIISVGIGAGSVAMARKNQRTDDRARGGRD